MTTGKIAISQQDYVFFIDLNSIIFIKADNCYTNLHIKGGKTLLVVKSLAKFQRELSEIQFIRVNQSYLINKDYIERVDKKKRSIELLENHMIHFTITLKELLVKIS